MRKLNRLATPLIAVAIMSSVPFVALAQNSQAGNQPQNNTAVQEWNSPPAGTEQAQQGYRDGIEAAKLDALAKRKIDAKSSHLYQHPPVKGDARDAYRSAFESGYQAAVKHGAAS
jgi:N-acetyl-beta-hexosaminidase